MALQTLYNYEETGFLNKLRDEGKLMDSGLLKFENNDHGATLIYFIPKLIGQKLSAAEKIIKNQIEKLKKDCQKHSKKIGINSTFFQSNIEGEIVTIIQDARNVYDGIIINAAGFTHTSVAIRDALAIFRKPSIELHISNIYKREEFRQKSLISEIVTGIICGLGANGYILAINACLLYTSPSPRD